MASFGGRVSIDLGTGDGRLPYVLAARDPARLFVGIDANAAALRELSGRALRARAANLLYVRAAVESLPAELAGVADRVTVVLPWGSLLAAVARPVPEALTAIRALCRPRAALTLVLGVDASRDAAEAARLGLPALDAAHLLGPCAAVYRAAGLSVESVRGLGPAQLASWPSTWARRLAFGAGRQVFQVEARAVPVE